jgi:hypothetical protein
MVAIAQRPPEEVPTSAEPGHRFGLTQAIALILGSIIGVGIFNLPTSLSSYGPITLFSMALTTVGALAPAVLFAALSRRLPADGGPYAYARVAFGCWRIVARQPCRCGTPGQVRRIAMPLAVADSAPPSPSSVRRPIGRGGRELDRHPARSTREHGAPSERCRSPRRSLRRVPRRRGSDPTGVTARTAVPTRLRSTARPRQATPARRRGLPPGAGQRRATSVSCSFPDTSPPAVGRETGPSGNYRATTPSPTAASRHE